MKIIREATENAYMIRNDGKAFKMLQHVYGNKDEVEETLAAAQWLYSATQHKSTQHLILDFIASWGYHLDSSKSVVSNIYAAIKERPYRFLDSEFINSIEAELNSATISSDVEAMNALIVDELNQEFLRARYGGMYNSTVGNREMVFRVSSVGFNWFKIIFEFVYDNRSKIDSVTIVKDEESTGFDDVYTHSGHKMYKLPIDEFIMLPGNPVVEKLQANSTIMERLASGLSIESSVGKNMNRNRLVEKYERVRYNILKELKEI